VNKVFVGIQEKSSGNNSLLSPMPSTVSGNASQIVSIFLKKLSN